MKKIGIDARLYSQTGVGTYLQNLLANLDEKNNRDLIFYIYLRKEDVNKITFKSKNIFKKIANHKWHSFAEQILFLFQLIRDRLDLVHFTYFSYPIFYWKKFVATVHDTTPLFFKTGKASTKNQFIYRLKHLMFKIVLYFQVNMAKKIITPTKTVREELIKIYGEKISDKVIPLYEGVSSKILKIKENKNLERKYQNFFVYVGNFYPHKNVERLISSFLEVKKGYQLILLGPKDYFSLRISRYLKQKKSPNVILINNPSLSDLVFYYKNALAIIHPSLSEGFGLPLIEAAYFGTPIIASNISVFRELWKDQYVAFDPLDEKDITSKINSFIVNKPTFNYSLLLKHYSFKNMTEETYKIYQSITQNS